MIRQCIAIAFIVLLSVSGCGRKTPPVPPGAVIPLPVTDLRHLSDNQGAYLTWTSPSFADSGSAEKSIRSFLVLQAEESGETCPDCPVRYNRSFSVDAAGTVPGEKIQFRLPDLKIRHFYHYKVISRAGWGVASPDSNEISFLWENPPMAPAGVLLMPADGRMTVKWQPVTALSDGRGLAEAVRYQVFRSENGENFMPSGAPQTEVTYVDTGLTNGRTYYYRVRAFHLLSGTERFSGASETSAASPIDTTPPAPPYGITVVETVDAVKVLWEDIGGSDVAGYRIYRRLEGEKNYTLAGETGSNTFTFVDRHFPASSETLFYSMTAFDHADPPNESIFSMEREFHR